MVRSQRGLLLLGIMVTLGSLVFSRPVAAQIYFPTAPKRPDTRYTPKLSPYLDLMRADNSVLPPYYSFVVPRRELHQQQLRQAVEINRLQQATSQNVQPNASGDSSRLPTGRGGRFQTYLHFYGRSGRP